MHAYPGEPEQKHPGSPAEEGKPSQIIQRRFLSKANVATLSPGERAAYKKQINQYFGARSKDYTDKVAAAGQEIARLETAANTAEAEARNPTQLKPGMDAAIYRHNSALIAKELRTITADLKKEVLRPAMQQRRVAEFLTYMGREGMSQTQRATGWLCELCDQAHDKFTKDEVAMLNDHFKEIFTPEHKRKVFKETAIALSRRIFYNFRAMAQYRGDAHQSADEPLKQNKRLDQFNTSTGAGHYNELWQKYEEVSKAESRDQNKYADVVRSLQEMKRLSPRHQWQAWKLERHLNALLEQEPKLTPEQIKEHMRGPIAEAKGQVDAAWLPTVMSKHIGKDDSSGRAKWLKSEIENINRKLNQPGGVVDADELRAQKQTHERHLGNIQAQRDFWSTELPIGMQRKAHDIVNDKLGISVGKPIYYKMGGAVSPILPAGESVRKQGALAAKKQADIEIERRRTAAPGAPVDRDAIARNIDEAEEAGRQEALAKQARPHRDEDDQDDAWLDAWDDPGIDYDNIDATYDAYRSINKAQRAAMGDFTDTSLETLQSWGSVFNQFQQVVQSVDQSNSGIAQNFTSEGSSMADSNMQDINGDFAALYDQIMGMYKRLTPIAFKVQPWG